MAANWPRVPAFDSADQIDAPIPERWRIDQIESLYDQLPIGKRFEQKSSCSRGTVPVIDQSPGGIIGWHDEQPGVAASYGTPVVTFANHTCEMRLMRRPFSVIQNVFPLVGKSGVCDTGFLYYGTKGRVHLEEYKGHYPDFRRKWILVPPLPEQRAIAHILGTLDDKIELNRRMNETLEAMARALFKSWFVDFDPVRAKAEGRDPGLPQPLADLFPARLVDSELGEIPVGWSAESIYAVTDVIYGAPFSSSQFNTEQLGEPLIRIRDLANESPGVWTPEVHPKGYKVKPGDIVVGMDGEFRAYLWGGDEAWLNQRVCVFAPKASYSAAFVRNGIFAPLAHIEATETATTVIHLGKSDIDRFAVVVPNAGVLGAFNQCSQPWYDRTVAAKRESRTLATLSDTLLPKLISGELRLTDAERFLEGVSA